jgi:hypothetical protein
VYSSARSLLTSVQERILRCRVFMQLYLEDDASSGDAWTYLDVTARVHISVDLSMSHDSSNGSISENFGSR